MRIGTIKLFASIRWKILLALFLIIVLSFVIMAGSLTRLLNNYLFEQRVRQDRLGLDKWALQLAEPVSVADTREIKVQLERAAQELSGRVLMLDNDGKVHVDSRKELNGMRFDYPEVSQVLVLGKPGGYGIHSKHGPVSDLNKIGESLYTDPWVSVCSSAIVKSSQIIGVLVLVSSVNEMMGSLEILRNDMLMVFIVVALTAMFAGMLFARVLTNPITELTRVIQKMGRGDFSARVPIRKGSGEIKEMALAFNSMSDKLETLEQSRNQFVSDASHELKTPLTTMKIMLESIIEQPDMEEELRTEFLTDTNKEIDRLNAVITDLLTLVKADSHSMRLNRENMSFASLVKEAIHKLEPIINKNEQRLTLSVEDSCDMYADKDKLMQVVYNLVENASKYTQKEGAIEVKLSKLGKNALLEVSDNGPGISKEHVVHIFQRFYRVDKARSRETGGTGLGLSIAKQIVLLHSGTIDVESQEGEGSKFIVKLPLHTG